MPSTSMKRIGFAALGAVAGASVPWTVLDRADERTAAATAIGKHDLAVATPVANVRPSAASAPAAEPVATAMPGDPLPTVAHSNPAVAARPRAAAYVLPTGVRAEDVEVSETGIVTVLRNRIEPNAVASSSDALGYGAAALPDRPRTVTRAE